MLRIGVTVCSRKLFSNVIKQPVKKVPEIKKFPLPTMELVRTTSFFNKLDGQLLWKGVTSVSNAGKKRGRGKGTDKKGKKNLNYGQQIGVGKSNMVWPGLTSPIIQHKTLMAIHKSPKPLQVEGKDSPQKLKKDVFKLHPLERGWSGKSVKGRSLGSPDPIGEETFEDFDSIVVSQKLVSTMTPILGRKRRYVSIVVVGNGNGLIGLGKSRSLDAKSSLRQAKNKAAKRLLGIDLINKHTINHDFFSQFGRTKLYASKQPEGYGLVCHRAIAACCKLVGIKDIHVKVEGSLNLIHVLRAFLLGLLNQKNYQEIADNSKLHLVEFRPERMYYPEVLASPKTCLTPLEVRRNPVNFEEYIMGNRLVLKRPRKVPFYEKLPSWTKHLKKTLYKRNIDKVKIELLAEHGKLCSFLADRYPECTSQPFLKKKSSE